MGGPHPKSGQSDGRNSNEAHNGGIVRKLIKRTIDIANDRNAEDEVNPARNRAFSGLSHIRVGS